MGRKGKEDQSPREGQCQYQKGEWSQKGTQKGFAFCRREARLVRSIIRGHENGSIIDYFPLLPDLQEHNSDKKLSATNACPTC